MEFIAVELNAEKFDKAVHGGLDHSITLKEGSDLAFYIKPNATVNGNPMAVVTFTVELPDGTLARAQAATTLKLLVKALGLVNALAEAEQRRN